MMGVLEEGFVALRPWSCGIYLLCQGQQVVYVGQSKQLYQRIAQHLMRRKKAPTRAALRNANATIGTREQIQFDRVYVRWCEAGELRRLEWKYIDRYNPIYNRHKLPQTNFDVEELARELGMDLDAIIAENATKPNSNHPAKRQFQWKLV